MRQIGRPNGTLAAGDFVTATTYLDNFARLAPHGWEKRNVQTVLETQMINRDDGPPRAIATYFW